MTKRDDTSRREFIGLALSTAALSSLSPRELFAKGGAAGPGPQATAQREIPPLVDSPGWKEQGVENLTKSRYAKLRNVPVRAVTIKTAVWGRRSACFPRRRRPATNSTTWGICCRARSRTTAPLATARCSTREFDS